MTESALSYLLDFLCGRSMPDSGVEYPYRVSDGQRERLRIGYVADKDKWEHYDIVFVPSGFFDSEDYASEASLPTGPLPRIEGVPFLYGEARLERLDGCLAVYADLPASEILPLPPLKTRLSIADLTLFLSGYCVRLQSLVSTK